jgi:hypothetical protein
MKQGIPTIYHGIEYRSRLEAKWAAFFEMLNWQFTYEPFDGNGYIPDFVIHGDKPMIVEVKPAVRPEDYYQETEKITKGLCGIWDERVMIVGVTPQLSWGDYQPQPNMGLITDAPSYGSWNWTCVRIWPVENVRVGQRVMHPSFGLGTVTSIVETEKDLAATVNFYVGYERRLLLNYAPLKSIGVCDEYMSFVNSPCGSYDGNNVTWNEEQSINYMINDAWTWATNEVKWRGKDVA